MWPPRALGAPARRIVLRHVLPNIAAPLMVYVTLSLSTAILVEASLTFNLFGDGLRDLLDPTLRSAAS